MVGFSLLGERRTLQQPVANLLKLPSAILLGLEEISSGIVGVRELGEHGVPIYGVALHRTPALYSRWLTRGYVMPTTDAETVQLMNEIAATEGASFVLAHSERTALIASRAAAAGHLRGIKALVPTLDKLELVNDKASLYKFAHEINIPIPRTWSPQGASDAASPPADLTYPCILKYSDPYRIKPLLDLRNLPLFKTHYCYDEVELRRILLAHVPLGFYPLVQSFCPGLGLAHMFFMHEGKAILRFRHRRLLEWPPEGGVAAVCESLSVDDNDELFEKSEALLKRIGWEGAAQVEYRYDAASGRAAFMEVNGGRFWATLALPYHAGVPFVWTTYSVLGLNRPVVAKPYKAGMKCRYVAYELHRLMRLLFRPGQVQNRELHFSRFVEIATFLLRYVQPNTRYYLFSWRDPVPFLIHIPLTIRRKLNIVFDRLMQMISKGL